jgi:TonB-linked SusC/RagA family outer membrane protein
MIFLFMVVIPANSSVITDDLLQGTITVKGTVKDGSGEPLAGVSIAVKGTVNGTMTDIDGKYSISVPNSNATIVASYIGFNAQETKVGNRTAIDFTLEETDRELGEVVVVGYGVQKKINLTGSVATVQADKLESRAAPNVASSLSGLVAGMRVEQTSGNPGSESVNILIRGRGSFDGSGPMVIVDGALADMNTVNSDDVESITVLKDAASAAIYGSRAANGVILVSTKKGKQGAPTVTYSALFASEKASAAFQPTSSTADFMEMHNRATANSSPNLGFYQRYSQETIDTWRAAEANPNGTDNEWGIPNWLAYPNTDWSEYLYAPSFYQRHNLQVAGSSPTSSYLLSAGYQDNPGTLINTALKRYSLRANAESKIGNFITVGTQTYLTKDRKLPGSTSMTYLYQALPNITPVYNGKYGAPEDPGHGTFNNILSQVATPEGLNTTTRINTNWYASVDFGKGFSARGQFNYQDNFTYNENHAVYLPKYSFRTGEIDLDGGTTEQAFTYRSSSHSYNYTATALLNYNRTFGNHDVSGLLGYEQYYNTSSAYNATRTGLIDWAITDLASATDSNPPTVGATTRSDYAMLSCFGRVNYGYKGKYLAEANFRRDGSSRFATDHNWGTFPSFSAGWRISEESFFEPLKSRIDNLKLRGSWGELGNVTTGNYDWQATYQKKANVFGEDVYTGVVQTNIPNFLLSWEKVTFQGVGLDMLLLNRRLNVEMEYYSRLTQGILYTPPIYLTMGNVGAPKKNTADVQNQGFEITAGWNDKIGDVSYSVNANLSYNANKVVKYLGQLERGYDDSSLDIWGNPAYKYINLSDVSTGGDTRRMEGRIIDEYFLRTPYKGTGTYLRPDGSVDPKGGPKDGMIRTRDDLDWVNAMLQAGYKFNNQAVNNNPINTSTIWYGEILMADTNGDGNYGSDEDREFTGKSSLPRYGFGINLSAAWKGIDLSMNWAGNAGGYTYLYSRGFNQAILTEPSDVMPANARELYYYCDPVAAGTVYDASNTYDPANDPDANINAEYSRLKTGGGIYVSNDAYLFSTTYLKLKMLQIGYTLPKQWTQKAKASKLRIFATGENLLTLTNFPGVDPEIGGGFNVYPIARMLSAGFSITF